MRSFWIEITAEGRKTDVATGPRQKDGRCSSRVYVDLDGCSTKVVEIECFTYEGKKRVRVNVGPNVHLVWREEHKLDSMTELLSEPIPDDRRDTAKLMLKEFVRDMSRTFDIPENDIIEDYKEIKRG